MGFMTDDDFEDGQGAASPLTQGLLDAAPLSARQPGTLPAPPWSFREASMVQRKLDDALAAAQALRRVSAPQAGQQYLSMGAFDPLSAAQRFELNNGVLYDSPLGATAYGLARLGGASEGTARSAGATANVMELLASAATLGGGARGGLPGVARLEPYARPVRLGPNAGGGGALQGEPELPAARDNAEKVRSLGRQEESAQQLARAGYDVTRLPSKAPKGEPAPDFSLNGSLADAYAPARDTPLGNVMKTVGGKWEGQKVSNVVLNLDDSQLTVEQVQRYLRAQPNLLDNVVIIKNGEVTPLLRK